MRYVFLVIKILIALLFLLNLFFWVIAHGSGHRVPVDTGRSILVFGIFLIVAFVVVSLLDRRRKRQESGS